MQLGVPLNFRYSYLVSTLGKMCIAPMRPSLQANKENTLSINNRVDAPYDELQIGQTFRTGGRTITESDVVNFCMLTGNWLEIHSNTHYASKTRFGERLVQGSLVYAIIQGLIQFGPAVQANYGLDNLRYITPVHIGDTIYVVAEVIRKKEKDEKYGVITLLITALNQRGETAQRGEFSLLFLRKRVDLDALVLSSLPALQT
jgi:acyl dehydratase